MMTSPETIAIKEYKKHGGIIDAGQVAEFRRKQTEQFEQENSN
jgi:hypothetical protein